MQKRQWSHLFGYAFVVLVVLVPQWVEHPTLVSSDLIDAREFVAQVVAIIDGDTIEILHQRKKMRVRLFGIDAPERGQPFNMKAKEHLSGLVFSKTIKVRVQDTDSYGRIVGEIFLSNETNVNLEMVRSGMAWWYERYVPDRKDLEQAQEVAKRNQMGLWADPNPLPPWEWRRL